MKHLAQITCICVLALAAGCTTYRTPDGFQFSSTSGPAQVRSTLGAPDMVDEQDRYYLGPYRSTSYTYMERGYSVNFINGLVRGVPLIADVDRPELERRVRAFKEEVPKVSLNESAASVIAHLGPPEVVDVGYHEDGVLHTTYKGAYRGQFEHSPPPESVFGYWKARGLFITFRDGRVAKVTPLTDWHWRNMLHEEPPKG